jgi:hypothetical protein
MFSEYKPILNEEPDSSEAYLKLKELQSKILTCKKSLGPHIRKISKKKQSFYQIFYGIISDVIGFGLLVNNPTDISSYIILGQGTFILLDGIARCHPYTFPIYKIECIKYPPLTLILILLKQ